MNVQGYGIDGQCCAEQFYADTTDFTGLPDPSLNNTVAPATAGESDGDQYVALNQRTSFEPLFAEYGVDVSLYCPALIRISALPACAKSCWAAWNPQAVHLLRAPVCWV